MFSVAPRPATAPVERKPLNCSYEARFGTPDHISNHPEKVNGGPAPITRGLKPALTAFSDPMNPSDRKMAKRMVNHEDHKADCGRAGQRSRNPGMIPHHVDRAEGAEPRTVPHRYSTGHDYRPGKKAGAGYGTPVARASPIIGNLEAPAATNGHSGTALHNYLTDMKQVASARRMHKDWGPSAFTTKMNDKKVKLFSERRDEFRESGPPTRMTDPGVHPLTPRDKDEHPMFARKKRSPSVPPVDAASDDGTAASQDTTQDAVAPVRRRASSVFTHRDLQPPNSARSHHSEATAASLILSHEEASAPSLHRRQRAELRETSPRRQKVNARFEEINRHMVGERRHVQSSFESIKAKGSGTGMTGILFFDSAGDFEARSTGRLSRSTSVDSRMM